MKILSQGLLCLALIAIGCAAGYCSRPKCPIITERIDTVIVRDTIRDTVLVYKKRFIVHIDTVMLKKVADTAHIAVEVPIERKIYQTPYYRAEIEGFRPSLISMDVYRQTDYITKTERVSMPDTRRWGIGLSAGYGATIQGGNVRLSPYIGVGVHYRLFYLDKRK